MTTETSVAINLGLIELKILFCDLKVAHNLSVATVHLNDFIRIESSLGSSKHQEIIGSATISNEDELNGNRLPINVKHYDWTIKIVVFG